MVDSRRLLLVHAHPDDETINNGATMARYASEGVAVTLVTCTRGEEGEIHVPALEHLAADRDDALGDHRATELADAMAILGVTDHRFLAEPGELRDSGMAWDDSGRATGRTEVRPDTFWVADLLTSANRLVPIIRETRPQVLITYDEVGGYGHPDHIQAHRVATYAAALAAAPSYRLDLGDPWDVAKTYWVASPKSVMDEFIRSARAAGVDVFGDVQSADELPFVTPDELVTTMVDARAFAGQKVRALRAHATQVDLDGPFFALTSDGDDRWGMEYYRLVQGTPGPRDPATGFETDLFAGIE